MGTTTLDDLNPVYTREETRTYAGDYINVAHNNSFAVENTTVAMTFSVNQIGDDMALISKDQGQDETKGGFTFWIEKDGELRLTMEGLSDSLWLRVPDFSITANQTYHVAFSMGADGVKIWINGVLSAAEPEFTENLLSNTYSLVIGGTRAWRDSQTDAAHHLFQGNIGNVAIFDRELDTTEVIDVTQISNTALGNSGALNQLVSDLIPFLDQGHHSSEALLEMASYYGFNLHPLHGITRPADLVFSSIENAAETTLGTAGRDAILGSSGDDEIRGGLGADVIQGDHGADILFGDNWHDILDGGHGEDRIFGGAGNDLLISRADAREPDIAYVADRVEGDPYNELTNGKLYPDQPVNGDDLLVGGAGSDIFYFQTLINAKERYIEKHTRSDGSVNWHGVAGENDNLHDHWVDGIGNDVVLDFSKLDGDRLVIEGHTTKIWSIEYGDADDNGVLDHSIIQLYSEQGNAGAHNKDKLGTITVYGDLVTEADIETTSQPAYGIVRDIDELAEALKPEVSAVNTGPIAAPAVLPEDMAISLRSGFPTILELPEVYTLSGANQDFLDAGHHTVLAQSNITFGLSFSIASLGDKMALISKDGSGYGQGGGFAVWIEDDGDIVITQDSATDHLWYRVPSVALQEGQIYHLAISMGSQGVQVWLDGDFVGARPDFRQGLEFNDYALTLGASRSHRDSQQDSAHNLFEGTIGQLAVFDTQLSSEDIRALAADSRLGSGADDLWGTAGSDFVYGGDGNDMIVGLKGHDRLYGGEGNDILMGGLDADQLVGGEGMDEARYSDSGLGVTVDLTTEVNSGIATGDSFSSIENLFGSKHSDHLRGDGGENLLTGWNGNDFLFGRDGDDKLLGSNGNDIMWGGRGSDQLIGGAGYDEVRYTDSTKGLTVDLMTGANTWIATGDTFSSVEGVFGSVYDDSLHGNYGANRLTGFFGNDILSGRGGNDVLVGADGNDMMWGGAGNDTFLFDDGHDADVIMDFDATSGDKINLVLYSTVSSYSDLAGDITAIGSNVVIRLDGGDQITLKNVLLENIEASDFVF